MKRTLLSLAVLVMSLCSFAQTTSDFEGLLSSPNEVLNGSEAKLGTSYSNGNFIFPNYYDTAYGGYWRDGWAITNTFDTVTKDFNNLYGAVTGTGNGGSDAYVVGKSNAVIKLKSQVANSQVNGLYITNTTYAYHTIKDGNQFSKPFGGDTGNDKDYFVLTIKGYSQGVLGADSVAFYLADYRFDDNNQDYIVNDWQFVDLSGLGAVDSIVFQLETTDIGQFGPNTPYFFAIDDVISNENAVGIFEYSQQAQLNVWPNPSNGIITFENNNSEVFELYNLAGSIVESTKSNQMDLSNLKPGVYLLKSPKASTRIIKN